MCVSRLCCAYHNACIVHIRVFTVWAVCTVWEQSMLRSDKVWMARLCRQVSQSSLSLSASFIFTLIIQFHHQCQHSKYLGVAYDYVWADGFSGCLLLGTSLISHQWPNWKRTSWPGPIIILGHKEVGETDACSCGYGGQKVVVWHIISAQATSTNLCTVSQLSQWYGEWSRILSWINSFELG